MTQRKILLAGFDADSGERARSALHEQAFTVSLASSLHQAPSLVEPDTGALVVVHVCREPVAAFEAIRALHSKGAVVIASAEEKDPDTILRAMRAGASEFVVADDGDDLKRAVRTLFRDRRDKLVGTVTTLFGAKGGLGATSVALNLAGALHRTGERVCLVDLDLHFGDVLTFLDLSASYSIADLTRNMRRLDRELIDASVTRHASGIHVLAQSANPEEAEGVSAKDIEAMLAFLRHHFDRIIVDGVNGFDDVSLAALDASDSILLLFTQEVPAVRTADRCLDIFRRLGYLESRVRLVINRYQKSSPITADVVAESTGVPVSATVSNDFAAMSRAINIGAMLNDVAPRSRATGDIRRLIPLVRGESHQVPTRRGIFNLFTRGALAHGAQ